MSTETRRSGRVAARVAAAPSPPPPVTASRRSSSREIRKPGQAESSLALWIASRTAAAVPKKKKKTVSKKKLSKQQRSNPRRKTLPNILHDEDGNEVWIAPLPAADIKKAQKTGKHPMSAKRLYLHTVPSPTFRQQVYDRTARAWQDLEQALLPTYGGRRWKVKVTIKDPTNAKGHTVSPFFYFHEGSSLELAVWPHWLLSIPQPPRFAGYARAAAKAKPVSSTKERGDDSESQSDDDDEEEELDEEQEELEEMQSREVSPLSQLAMSERWRVPVPSYSIKWLSPLHETFSTRKSAWEHAKKLSQQEVFLDKVLSGYNANGQAITKIVPPGKTTVLKAGHLRFLRDGLWVVGQEQAWQEERRHEMQTASIQAVVTPPATPRKLSPLACFLRENRKAHQAKRLAELSKDGEKARFTLQEADSELRDVWKQLADRERALWTQRAQQSDAAEKDVASSSTHEDVWVSTPPRLKQDPEEPLVVGAARAEPDQKPSAAAEDTQPAAAAPKDESSSQQSGRNEATSATAGRVTPPSETEASSNPKTYESSGGVLSVEYPKPWVNPHAAAGEKPSTPNHSQSPSRSPPPAKKQGLPKALDSKPSASDAWCLNENQVKLCYDTGLEHYDRVLATVQARDLSRELQDGFDVLRERGKGRFDMELPDFDHPNFGFITNLKKTPWMPIVRQILGKDVVLIHKGIFLSLPGAAKQDYHQDGPHLTTHYQKPCHAINVFVPLVDLAMQNGPTEFCLGSHILGQEDYDDDFIETPIAKAGTPIIFDYRLGHRGLANSSNSCRPILYCTYAAAADGKEFRDSVNFSRKRYHKIGDMVTKSLSRDERAQKRQKT